MIFKLSSNKCGGVKIVFEVDLKLVWGNKNDL